MMCSLSLRKASVASRCSGVPLPPRGRASPGRGPWAVEGVRGGAMGFHREAPPSPAGGAPTPLGFSLFPAWDARLPHLRHLSIPAGTSDQMVGPWPRPQLSENRSGLIRFRRWSPGGPAVVPEGPCLFDFPAQTHLFKQTPQGLQ